MCTLVHIQFYCMLRGLLYYILLLFGPHKSSLDRNVREVVLAVHALPVTCRSSQAAQRQLHVIKGCIKPCILTFRHFWRSKCLTFHHLIPLIQSLCMCHTTQYSCSVGMEKHIKPRCYEGVFNLFFFTANALNAKIPRCWEENEDFFPEVLQTFFVNSYSWTCDISEHEISSVLFNRGLRIWIILPTEWNLY